MKLTVESLLQQISALLADGKIELSTVVQSEGCDCTEDAGSVAVTDRGNFDEPPGPRLVIERWNGRP